MYSHKWPPGDTLKPIYGNQCIDYHIWSARLMFRHYHDTFNEHHVLEILHSCISTMSGSELVALRIFKSIRNATDEGRCKDDCERGAVCSIFRRFMDGLQGGRHSGGLEHTEREHNHIKKELCEFLTEKNVSLMDHLCHGVEDRSVLQALLTIDEGCEIITNQLDSLKESKNSRKTNIEVKLGSGKLFDLDKPCEQARILSELLGVRNRTEQGRSLESLTALIKHPILVIFIREKWEKIKFAFFVHLR